MRLFGIFLLLLTLAACNSADKKPVEHKIASSHSGDFNRSFETMLKDYYSLSESFVNWDSNSLHSKAQALESSLKKISLEDLKKDNSVYTTAQETLKNTSASLADMARATDITSKRRYFNTLTQNIYDLLRVVKYDQKKLYLQECGMPFDEGGTAVWLTDKGSDSIRNPYLGLHHPKYGSSMLECGSNISIIDFQK